VISSHPSSFLAISNFLEPTFKQSLHSRPTPKRSCLFFLYIDNGRILPQREQTLLCPSDFWPTPTISRGSSLTTCQSSFLMQNHLSSTPIAIFTASHT